MLCNVENYTILEHEHRGCSFEESPTLVNVDPEKKLCRAQKHKSFCGNAEPISGFDLKDVAEKFKNLLPELYRALVVGNDIDPTVCGDAENSRNSSSNCRTTPSLASLVVNSAIAFAGSASTEDFTAQELEMNDYEMIQELENEEVQPECTVSTSSKGVIPEDKSPKESAIQIGDPACDNDKVQPETTADNEPDSANQLALDDIDTFDESSSLIDEIESAISAEKKKKQVARIRLKVKRKAGAISKKYRKKARISNKVVSPPRSVNSERSTETTPTEDLATAEIEARESDAEKVTAGIVLSENTMQSTSQNASSSKSTEEINSVRTGPQPEIVVESAPQVKGSESNVSLKKPTSASAPRKNKRKVSMPVKFSGWLPEAPEKRQKKVRVSDRNDDDDVQILGVWSKAQPLPPNFPTPSPKYAEIHGYKKHVFTPDEIINHGDSKEEIIDLT